MECCPFVQASSLIHRNFRWAWSCDWCLVEQTCSCTLHARASKSELTVGPPELAFLRSDHPPSYDHCWKDGNRRNRKWTCGMSDVENDASTYNRNFCGSRTRARRMMLTGPGSVRQVDERVKERENTTEKGFTTSQGCWTESVPLSRRF